eukprot:GDKH01016693.1.p1 GENE.GDKH01016693.1~~GDKH01016693.1.p1  ORF type:complete len:224 (+),score=27.03 GDKH01016693.1:195-866(+)
MSAGEHVRVSEMFETYETDLKRELHEVHSMLQLANERGGMLDDASVSKCQDRLKVARDCLAQLDSEARTLPNNGAVLPTVAQHRRWLESLQKEVKTKKEDGKRRALLGDRDGTMSQEARAQRQRLLEVENKLKAGNDELRMANRVALETEEVAMGTVTELRGQREQIGRMRANMGTVSSNLDTARQLVNNMSRRAVQNKAMLYGVSALLVLTILYILYAKVFG